MVILDKTGRLPAYFDAIIPLKYPNVLLRKVSPASATLNRLYPLRVGLLKGACLGLSDTDSMLSIQGFYHKST